MLLTQHLDATFAAPGRSDAPGDHCPPHPGEASVMELARPFDMSQPAISKHIKVLEQAGLVSRGQDAQRAAPAGWSPSRLPKPPPGSNTTASSSKRAFSASTPCSKK
jgi:hypothetical protein